jgi:hypothetical protein
MTTAGAVPGYRRGLTPQFVDLILEQLATRHPDAHSVPPDAVVAVYEGRRTYWTEDGPGAGTESLLTVSQRAWVKWAWRHVMGYDLRDPA